jgi:hypothetical protein
MDPFAQQVQRLENTDKLRDLVEALRLLPVQDANTRQQLQASFDKLLTPVTHQIPETQRKITEFSFEEPEHSYQDIAARQRYRPMKHGIHYLD